MTELTNNDYKHILAFYKKPIPKSRSLLRKQAENLIAKKLCRCIKKVDKVKESRSIGICSKTVINNKGFLRGKFTCKNKPTIVLFKQNKTKKHKK
jgi:hypothetical protein